MLVQNFRGANKAHYGICASGVYIWRSNVLTSLTSWVPNSSVRGRLRSSINMFSTFPFFAPYTKPIRKPYTEIALKYIHLQYTLLGKGFSHVPWSSFSLFQLRFCKGCLNQLIGHFVKYKTNSVKPQKLSAAKMVFFIFFSFLKKRRRTAWSRVKACTHLACGKCFVPQTAVMKQLLRCQNKHTV